VPFPFAETRLAASDPLLRARLLTAVETRRRSVGKELSLPCAICEFRTSAGSPLFKCGQRLSNPLIRNKLYLEEREVHGVIAVH
jgi:hypothetical protein